MQLLLQLQDVVDVDYDDNGDHDDHEHEDGKDDQLPVHAWWQCNKSWTSSSELKIHLHFAILFYLALQLLTEQEK